MSLPDSIAALPKRADELRELLIKWCDQNSGRDHPADSPTGRDAAPSSG